MFCDRCGRLRNRATGRCVCDDDPSLAVPVAAPVGAAAGAVGAAGGAASEMSPAVPSYAGVGAAPPAASLSEREVAELAVAARQVTALDGRAPEREAIDASVAAVYEPKGRVRATIGGLREGRRKVDLRIHEDALVVATGSDTGPAIPLDQVVAITVHRKPWGGTIHIGAGRSGSRTLAFSKRKHSCNDVAAQMQAIDPRRFGLIPESDAVRLAYKGARVALVLVALAAIAVPVKAFVFPPSQPGDDLPAAARDAMRDACPTWRSSPMTGTALAATAAQLREPFSVAAGASDVFASLPQDIALVESFAPKAGRPDVPLVEAAAFSSAVDRIDTACARVGR